MISAKRSLKLFSFRTSVIAIALASATFCLAQADAPPAAESIETLTQSTEALIKTAPTPDNYLNLSLQYDRAKRYQDSISACNEALKIDPNNAGAYNNIASAYNGLKMWDAAITAANNAIRLSPEFELAKNNLAVSESQKKLQADSVASAQEQVKNSPTPENYLSLSLAHDISGNYLESIAACKKALQLKPDYAEAYNNIAAGYGALLRWDEAIDAAKQAVKLKPDFQLAQNNLQYALDQKKSKDAAIAAKQ